MNTSVLMYHAVFKNIEKSTSLIKEGADLHYAVTSKTFENHLNLIDSQGYLGASLKSIIEQHSCILNKPYCAITFDDGHESNYHQAFPILDKMQFTADFFINTAVSSTKHFMSWSQLREMAEAGQSIQSHGHDHHYFDQMDAYETRRQLETSKKLIEDHVGKPVTIFAPPGGRLSAITWKIAQELGYTAISSSRPGTWKNIKLLNDIPRFAVLQSTSDYTIKHWITGQSTEIIKLILKYQATYMAKKLLGNKNYEKIRAALLS